MFLLLILLNLMPRDNSGHCSYKGGDTLYINSIEIKGNPVLSRKEIRNIFPEEGDIFDYRRIEESIDSVLSYYSNRGFPFVTLKLSNFSIDLPKIDFCVDIDAGALYRTGEIIIKGTINTSNQFLRSLLDIGRDEIYNQKLINKEIEKLNKLDFIKVDSFRLSRNEIKNILNPVLFISEIRKGVLNGAFSVSREGNWSGELQAGGFNFLGKGREFNLFIQKNGDEFQQEKLNYEEPYLFNTPFSLNFSIQHTYIDSSYNLTSAAGGLKYSIGKSSLSLLPGMENFAAFEKKGISYYFIESIMEFESENIEIYYRQKWKENMGWDLSFITQIRYRWLANEIEYFSISSDNNELSFFTSPRGYYGIKASEGIKYSIELCGRYGELMVYPFFDVSWIDNEWLNSYGLGFSFRRSSIEYAIPYGENPFYGRIYIKLN